MYYDPIVKQSEIRLIQDRARGTWSVVEVGGNYSITVNKDMTKSIIKQVLHLEKK